jgi:Xaa-Pro aminopeptidase
LFEVLAWGETEDPIDLAVSSLAGTGLSKRGHLSISDRAWSTSLLSLQAKLPKATWQTSSQVVSPLRSIKDEFEIASLRAAAGAADRVAGALLEGEIPLVGRTETQVSDEIGARLLEEGHQQVNFAIVGSGANAASPHHEPGSRTIGAGETVVCDFGGTLALEGSDIGYCSDITRTVVTGEPTAEVARSYAVLLEAQQAAVAAARAGVPAEDVDAVARDIITEAGYGANFIHRTGHGIGIEEHEDPYLVSGNSAELVEGNAFSIEPGIYVEGRFGMRIEDIVVVGSSGPESLNNADHQLVVVDG